MGRRKRMKWSWFGRASMALLSALALGLGMTACGGSTIAYMWVLGQQYNQIYGFKVDNNTGNLTAIQNSPFATNGSKPVYLVVKPGGRYVYVVNQGSNSTPTSNGSGNIAVFSVGGDGALTFQQAYDTKGFVHQWAQFDSSGAYLSVLDKYSKSGDGNGAITTYAADPTTGRLTLVTQTAGAASGAAAPTFIEVGPNPISMLNSGSCLFTLNGGNQTVTPYNFMGGQLSTTTTGNITVSNAVNLTSINGNSNTVVLTDAGPSTTSNGITTYTTAGTILPYTVSNCGLTTFTGGGVANTSGVTDPVYSYVSNVSNNTFLFVLNATSASTNATTPYSQISAFNVVNSPTAQLAPVNGTPFPTGSHPVCLVEDPTNRFVYVSNQGGTITGYNFDNTRGTLSALSRGSSFSVNDNQLGCIALSGSVY